MYHSMTKLYSFKFLVLLTNLAYTATMIQNRPNYNIGHHNNNKYMECHDINSPKTLMNGIIYQPPNQKKILENKNRMTAECVQTMKENQKQINQKIATENAKLVERISKEVPKPPKKECVSKMDAAKEACFSEQVSNTLKSNGRFRVDLFGNSAQIWDDNVLAFYVINQSFWYEIARILSGCKTAFKSADLTVTANAFGQVVQVAGTPPSKKVGGTEKCAEEKQKLEKCEEGELNCKNKSNIHNPNETAKDECVDDCDTTSIYNQSKNSFQYVPSVAAK